MQIFPGPKSHIRQEPSVLIPCGAYGACSACGACGTYGSCGLLLTKYKDLKDLADLTDLTDLSDFPNHLHQMPQNTSKPNLALEATSYDNSILFTL